MSDLRTLVAEATDEQLAVLERLDDILNGYSDQRCQQFRLALSTELAHARTVFASNQEFATPTPTAEQPTKETKRHEQPRRPRPTHPHL